MGDASRIQEDSSERSAASEPAVVRSVPSGGPIPSPTARLTGPTLLSLQRSAGNRAVNRLISPTDESELAVEDGAIEVEPEPGTPLAPVAPSRGRGRGLQRELRFLGTANVEGQGNTIKVTGNPGFEYKTKIGKWGEFVFVGNAGFGGQFTVGPDPGSAGPVQPSTIETKVGTVKEGALKATVRAYENKAAKGWQVSSWDFEPEIGVAAPEKKDSKFGPSAGVAVATKVKFANNVELVGKLILVKVGRGKEARDMYEVQAFAVEGEAKDEFPLGDVLGQLNLGRGVTAQGLVTLSGKATIQPDAKAIAAEAAQRLGSRLGLAVIETAIEGMLVAGPPLLAGIVIAQGIYMAGEKGKLHANINEGAVDARQAAMTYAQVVSGSDIGANGGPRTQAAYEKAKQEVAAAAGRAQVPLEEFMSELRKQAPAPFQRVVGPARQQTFSAYDSEVRKVIAAWRAEHYILAIWTRPEDDVHAAMKQVNVIFSK